MTPQELQTLTASTQTDRFEKRRPTTDVDTFREALGSFSNDMAGTGRPGYLLIGVDETDRGFRSEATDANCLGLLKHYRSLMAMAVEARKPLFRLKSADGAIGAHSYAVKDCENDFLRLAEAILSQLDTTEVPAA